MSEQADLKKLSDQQLAELCQQELPYQTEAFAELVDRYKERIYRKALGMLKNHEDAEDATQNIFIKIFNGLPQYKKKASLSTWIYTITVNSCINHLDKRNRKTLWWLVTDIDEVQEQDREDRALFALVGQGLEQDELRKRIDRTLNRMSEPDRKILTLRFWDELDYNAIADRLGIKLSATKMRLKRAREDFINKFGPLDLE